MLLPETDSASALKVADKLRGVISKSSFNANGNKVSITISCGLTQFSGNDDNESLFVRADEALYQAKDAGRNCCILV